MPVMMAWATQGAEGSSESLRLIPAPRAAVPSDLEHRVPRSLRQALGLPEALHSGSQCLPSTGPPPSAPADPF